MKTTRQKQIDRAFYMSFVSSMVMNNPEPTFHDIIKVVKDNHPQEGINHARIAAVARQVTKNPEEYKGS